MTTRQRALAILHFQNRDRVPLFHFGFWRETLIKWALEGHISFEQAQSWQDGSRADREISGKLGFDGNFHTFLRPRTDLFPRFEERIIEEFPDGKEHVLSEEGVIIVRKKDVVSIPREVDRVFKGRTEWEREFKPRLQFCAERFEGVDVPTDDGLQPFSEGGLAYMKQDPENRKELRGLYCGSILGRIRNFAGLENISYLLVDDEELYTEMIDTMGELVYTLAEHLLGLGVKPDFGHFWEDICFKNGPLINPEVFRKKAGPHYRRITGLLLRHGIDIVTVDCDGYIDDLIPVWIENGVNTMFPIEVGTWKGSILPWRETYGRQILGVGGVDKKVFSRDRRAVDREVERMKPLVALGGFIPCPDHRLAPDSQWDLVRYYCEKMRLVYG